jgi:hypothetical protein
MLENSGELKFGPDYENSPESQRKFRTWEVVSEGVSVQGEFAAKNDELMFDGRQVWVNPDEAIVQFIRLKDSVPHGDFIYVHANGMIESGT